MKKLSINYQQIFKDILEIKCPNKKKDCLPLLNKNLSALDILEINNRVFDNTTEIETAINQRHRSYSKSDIIQILEYQKKHNLNDAQLANHFKLSRNSIRKWKKIFF